uniref:Uncharacterized protein n=1 Tax=viral metagenome TaxID=1070528 RepID=A0A6C0JK01_9ZZZZ
MWKWAVFNAALFYIVSYLGTKNHIHALLLALIFAVLHHFFGKQLIEGFTSLPDSRKTSCAKGSVPAGNGLDCKLPTDIYGL